MRINPKELTVRLPDSEISTINSHLLEIIYSKSKNFSNMNSINITSQSNNHFEYDIDKNMASTVDAETDNSSA
jgi:hypothetical protein